MLSNRANVLNAIDAAFIDEVKHRFRIISGEVTNPGDMTEMTRRFQHGLQALRVFYGAARDTANTVFPEGT